MWTAAFWRALAERAIKTASQSLAALMVADAVDLLGVDWTSILATAGITTLASILTTLGSGAITGGNASLATGSEVTTPPGTIAIDPDGDVHNEGA